MVIPDSSATSRTTVVAAVSPTSIRPPGSSQLPSSMRRTSRSWPARLRTAANAAGKTSWARGVFGSWEYSRSRTTGADSRPADGTRQGDGEHDDGEHDDGECRDVRAADQSDIGLAVGR